MIYLDYAATTPMSAESLEAYNRAAQLEGNAASVHRSGQLARETLEEGRALIAAALEVSPLEILFNSGGTEGDNHVLLGLALERPVTGNGGGHLIVSQIEHSAVLNAARWLEGRGYAVTYLEPNRQGRISAETLEGAMRPDTFLVSVLHSSNEVGTVQDLKTLAEVTHKGGALFHSDMVQSLGVLPLDLKGWNVDFATFSAHKFYGPKGVGFLYIKRGLELPPTMLGGGQERGLRGGTHNVAGAYSAGVAASYAIKEQAQTYALLRGLQTHFLEGISTLEGLTFNHPADGNPKVVSVTAHGADGEGLLMNLDLEGVAASLGSACSAGTLEPSHVLLALGLSDLDARSSLRFSFGKGLTEANLDAAAVAFGVALERSRG